MTPQQRNYIARVYALSPSAIAFLEGSISSTGSIVDLLRQHFIEVSPVYYSEISAYQIEVDNIVKAGELLLAVDSVIKARGIVTVIGHALFDPEKTVSFRIRTFAMVNVAWGGKAIEQETCH